MQFFQRMNINDYSVLLGIHQLQNPQLEAQAIRNATESREVLFKEGILNAVEIDELQSVISDETEQTDEQPLLHEKARPSQAFFEAQEGGMLSECGNFLYFMGIIDILTNYGGKKKVEFGVKRVLQGKTISCIPPVDYGNRFYNFMKDEVFK